MSPQGTNQISRRSAVALATVLTATVLTAVAAVGGIAHWGTQGHAAQPVVVQTAQPALTSPIAEESD